MKMKLLMCAVLSLFVNALVAQDMTADQVLDNYYENTGGKENWEKVKGMKMTASVNQGGMEIPLEIVQLADGRTYTKISLQGQNLMQNVFDGEVLWGMNFQSMKAEKSDEEATANMILDTNDFPDAFLNYKEKGYTLEMIGKETIEGTETYKLKLTKEPRMLDGKEVEDVNYYYFDTENFVPIVQESEIKQGQMAGKISQVILSDYQEVSDGLYMPYSMTQGIKGMGGQTIQMETITLNPEVDETMFAYPGE